MFVVVGLNHKNTSISERCQLAFTLESLPLALKHLNKTLDIVQAFIVSTCNRIEIYALAPCPHAIRAWLFRYRQVDPAIFTDRCYYHTDTDALRHLIRVASGLDSMVLGEPQIFGQIKTAYALSESVNMMGPELARRIQKAFSITKDVRYRTALGHCPVSVALSSVRLAEQNLDLPKAQVLVLGAGQTGRLLIQHLISAGVRTLLVANRTLEHAMALAAEFHSQVSIAAHGLSDLSSCLSTADLVITATTAKTPLITPALLAPVMSKRSAPLWLLDISETQNIDPGVSQIERVCLHTLDHVQQMIAHNTAHRTQAALEAQILIEDALSKPTELPPAHREVISSLRQKLSDLCEQELTRSLLKLHQGEDPETVLKQFAHRLTNKWSHQPTLHLKELPTEADMEQIKKLFGV